MKLFYGGMLSLSILGNVHADSGNQVFKDSDIEAGRILYEKNQCASCHTKIVGGDGSALYTRENRKVKTPSQLISQVAFCNTRLNANLFPEEEKDIAAYLNSRYYKFK